jgi:plastocyanin
MGWAAFGIAIAALFIGIFALAQVDDTPELAAGAEGGGAATVIDVELGAMVIVPDMLMAPPGAVELRVTNIDTQVHNLAVLGQVTPDLQPGESATLDLGVLDVGVYDTQCNIAGHAAAGMVGELHIVADGDSGSLDGEASGATDGATDDHLHGFGTVEEMEAAMTERALRFVEEDKTAFGGQPLEPEVLADGTKQFNLVAEIVDWEIEPGKIVQAWTYNGTVPAPVIKVDVGDNVRVVLENKLPTATTIHWHGIRVPNAMDGVPPFTQPGIMPGETFTYEFEALEPAVGIYHSHNGADQVLDGLFGAFKIGDMAVPDVLLEQGFKATPDQEIDMVLNDAGVIGLTLNGKSFPATEPYTAKVGDTVLVHYYNEGLTAHPMHLHQPIGWIIAKDGKEMLVPIPGDTINVAPGERYSVLYIMVDAGVWAWHCHILTHAEGNEGMFGMVTAFIVEE